jgi:hypothetical protein
MDATLPDKVALAISSFPGLLRLSGIETEKSVAMGRAVEANDRC